MSAPESGLEPIAKIMDRLADPVSEAAWEKAVLAVFDIAAPPGGSDERAERGRQAFHALLGQFVPEAAWRRTQTISALPEPVWQLAIAHGLIVAGLIYSTAPANRARRMRLLRDLFNEADAVSAELRRAS